MPNNDKLTRNRFYEVVDTIGDFTPSLSAGKLSLTSLISDIKRSDVEDIEVIDAQTGVNGIYDQGSFTPTDGVTYKLRIPTSQYISGHRQIYTITAVADGTAQTDLTDKFVSQINANTAIPVTASNNSNVLRLTEDPTVIGSDRIAGEVLVPYTDVVMTDRDGNSTASFSEDTAHADPIGQPEVINRIFEGDDDYPHVGNQLTGTISTSAAYDQIVVRFRDEFENINIDTIYVDTTVDDYVKNVAQEYASELGFEDRTSLLTLAGEASASSSSTVPRGVKRLNLDTSSNTNFTIDDTWAVGESFQITSGTSGVVEMPAGEQLNGGTAGGTATLPSDHLVTFVKDASDNWIGYATAEDGTAPDSTAADVPASS